MNFKRIAALVLLSATITSAAFAGGAADATLRTDHPQYPGEGAFQTIDDCVRFATDGKQGEQERAIALYLWMLTHQWHLHSPQEWNVPGEVPDSKSPDQEMIVYDANRARFSYGYGLCGTVHSWNEPYWKALGMNVRRRAFPGHVNSEVQYGDNWHAFDTDMAGIVFRDDGQVAGYDDIIAKPSLVKQTHAPLPCYPFAWPSDFNSMKKGWEQVAAGGKWYKLYNSGYAAHPGIVHVRRGETFTRWYDRDHFGGPSKRRFWHNLPGGPFRNWTFANNGTPHHDGEKHNARGNASYCNGEFIYRPDLTSDAYRDGVVFQSDGVATSKTSPHLRAQGDHPVAVTFEHFSPYVICGDPIDDANPMSGKATDGFVVSGKTVGEVGMELSVDHGQSWQAIGEFNGEFERDLTEQVKGRYGWKVRFTFGLDAGIDELQFATTTQVCQAIYPRLKSEGTRVTFQQASQGVTPVLPNFALQEKEIGAVEVRDMRSENVVYHARSKQQRLAYETTNNKPGQVVFRVDTGPNDLQEVRAAGRYKLRVPSPEDCDFRIEISTDQGNSWQLLAKSDIASDNEYSSGWMYGTADMSDKNVREALVRMTFYQGGYSTGLIDAQIYGIHRQASAGEATVTYCWREEERAKTHTEEIPSGAKTHTFDVPTGKDVRDEFVRIEVR